MYVCKSTVEEKAPGVSRRMMMNEQEEREEGRRRRISELKKRERRQEGPSIVLYLRVSGRTVQPARPQDVNYRMGSQPASHLEEEGDQPGQDTSSLELSMGFGVLEFWARLWLAIRVQGAGAVRFRLWVLSSDMINPSASKQAGK
jgi:hypothetical protein